MRCVSVRTGQDILREHAAFLFLDGSSTPGREGSVKACIGRSCGATWASEFGAEPLSVLYARALSLASCILALLFWTPRSRLSEINKDQWSRAR